MSFFISYETKQINSSRQTSITPVKPSNIEACPTELLMQIFSFLKLSDLFRAVRVCKTWNLTISDPFFTKMSPNIQWTIEAFPKSALCFKTLNSSLRQRKIHSERLIPKLGLNQAKQALPLDNQSLMRDLRELATQIVSYYPKIPAQHKNSSEMFVYFSLISSYGDLQLLNQARSENPQLIKELNNLPHLNLLSSIHCNIFGQPSWFQLLCKDSNYSLAEFHGIGTSLEHLIELSIDQGEVDLFRELFHLAREIYRSTNINKALFDEQIALKLFLRACHKSSRSILSEFKTYYARIPLQTKTVALEKAFAIAKKQQDPWMLSLIFSMAHPAALYRGSSKIYQKLIAKPSLGFFTQTTLDEIFSLALKKQDKEALEILSSLQGQEKPSPELLKKASKETSNQELLAILEKFNKEPISST